MSGDDRTRLDYQATRQADPIEGLLGRIADALDRAYPKQAAASAADLLGDPTIDPVIFLMQFWGETREDAEKIVATTRVQEETDQPSYYDEFGFKVYRN